jgi:predicted secreted Zn-dependent protease
VAQQQAISTASSNVPRIDNQRLSSLIRSSILLLSTVVLFGASLSAARPGVASEPQVSTKKRTYEINGSTAAELREQMQRLGPKDKAGIQRYAYTGWYVRWTFNCERSAGAFRLASYTAAVTIDFTLPKWNSPADADNDLRTKWDAFSRALQTHEDGHRDIGVQAGKAVLAAFRSLPDSPTCESLYSSANAAGQRIVQEFRQKETVYDRETGNGVTQGVRLQ